MRTITFLILVLTTQLCEMSYAENIDLNTSCELVKNSLIHKCSCGVVDGECSHLLYTWQQFCCSCCSTNPVSDLQRAAFDAKTKFDFMYEKTTESRRLTQSNCISQQMDFAQNACIPKLNIFSVFYEKYEMMSFNQNKFVSETDIDADVDAQYKEYLSQFVHNHSSICETFQECYDSEKSCDNNVMNTFDTIEFLREKIDDKLEIVINGGQMDALLNRQFILLLSLYVFDSSLDNDCIRPNFCKFEHQELNQVMGSFFNLILEDRCQQCVERLSKCDREMMDCAFTCITPELFGDQDFFPKGWWNEMCKESDPVGINSLYQMMTTDVCFENETLHETCLHMEMIMDEEQHSETMIDPMNLIKTWIEKKYSNNQTEREKCIHSMEPFLMMSRSPEYEYERFPDIPVDPPPTIPQSLPPCAQDYFVEENEMVSIKAMPKGSIPFSMECFTLCDGVNVDCPSSCLNDVECVKGYNCLNSICSQTASEYESSEYESSEEYDDTGEKTPDINTPTQCLEQPMCLFDCYSCNASENCALARVENTLCSYIQNQTRTYNFTKINTNANEVAKIPFELSLMPTLIELSMNYNKLSGTIPHFTQSKMKHLTFDTNKLSGTIPEQLGGLTSLTSFSSYNNQISGTIPSELFLATKMIGLSLGKNKFSGMIPEEIGGMTALRRVYMNENSIEGSIPSSIGLLSSLTSLYLQDNKLSSSIPQEMMVLTELKYLDVSLNQLNGYLTSEIGNLVKMQSMSLYSNSFSGFLPTDLEMLTSLSVLFTQGNLLSGSIPISLYQITRHNFGT